MDQTNTNLALKSIPVPITCDTCLTTMLLIPMSQVVNDPSLLLTTRCSVCEELDNATPIAPVSPVPFVAIPDLDGVEWDDEDQSDTMSDWQAFWHLAAPTFFVGFGLVIWYVARGGIR